MQTRTTGRNRIADFDLQARNGPIVVVTRPCIRELAVRVVMNERAAPPCADVS